MSFQSDGASNIEHAFGTTVVEVGEAGYRRSSSRCSRPDDTADP